MRIEEIPVEDRPRERLKANGAEVLSVRELVAIVLGSGNRQRGAIDLADDLVSSLESIRDLALVVGDEVPAGVVFTTFHHPVSGANVVTTDNSDWATNCPEYKVTAVQATRVTQPSEWQKQQAVFNRQQKEYLDKARKSGA